MKKKIFVLVFLLFLVNIIRAQVLIALVFGKKLNTEKLEFGLNVSPALTNISAISGKYNVVMDLGLYFNIKMSQNFFLHPEAIAKSSFGAKGVPVYSTGDQTLDDLYKTGSVTRKIKAVSLPLLVHYRIVKFWFAEAGPQIDWNLRAKDIFKNKVNGNELDYTTSVKSNYTTFSFGLAGGVQYKLRKDKGMGFGIRYYYGLTDIMKYQTGNQGNRVWMLIVSIPIGTGKTDTTINKQ